MFTVWDKSCMNERGVKEEKSSLYEISSTKYVWLRKKMRYDDIRDPDMIAMWRVVHHNLKIES